MAQTRKKPKAGGNKTPKPTRQDLIEEALDYHKQGWGTADIASAMKLGLDAAKSLIADGLQQVEAALPETRLVILTEIARLQDAQKAIYTNVANGEPEAIRLFRSLEKDIAEAKVRLDPTNREIFGNAALYELGKLWATPAKRGRGRPAHQPTVANVAKVQALTVAGCTKEETAKIVGIDVDTLDKYYKTIMDVAKAHVMGLLVGSVIEGAVKDPRLALDVLSRQRVDGFTPPVVHTPPGAGAGKNNSDEYSPAAVTDSAGNAKQTVHRVEVVGGLPVGSTPEKPEGTEYSEVPPEEERH